MEKAIEIFKRLAEDDEAREEVCNAIQDSKACDCTSYGSFDSACDGCPYRNHESMQRAANTLKNRLGG